MEDIAALRRKTLIGIARMQAVLAILIFGPAWSVAYWQGWLFWSLMLACILPLTLYFLRTDPALIRRRMNAGPTAETRSEQKVIQSFTSVFCIAVIIVAALDHRYGWSSVPTAAVLAGDVLVVLGFGIVFFVLRENSFASSIIETADGQTVIDSGLYAYIRHPMYSGALLIFFGTPVALDSWWGLIPAALVTAAIVWRLLDEEKYLAEHLRGYTAYQAKVRWRLVPGLW